MKGKHLFKVFRILGKIGVKPQAEENGKAKSQAQLGIDITFDIINNIYKAEDEVVEFLEEYLGEKDLREKELEYIIEKVVSVKDELVKLFTFATSMKK